MKRVVTLSIAFLFLACSKMDSPSGNVDQQHNEWVLMGLAGEPISHVVASPGDAGILFAASGLSDTDGVGMKLFRSVDGGIVWDTLLTGDIVSGITIDPLTSDILYASGAGLFRSGDIGQTWQRLDNSISYFPWESPRTIALFTDHQGHLFYSTGGVHNGRQFLTGDNGANWTAVEGLMVRSIVAHCLNPLSSVSMIIATDWTPALYMTMDAGMTWFPIDWDKESAFASLGVSQTGEYYAGTFGKGLYCTQADESGWNRVEAIPETAVVRSILCSEDGTVYASASVSDTESRVYAGSSSQEWTMLGADFTSDVRSLTISSDGVLFAGSDGVYRYEK
jgi:photosystem II stability/assembly factor-like uncharacterized protein